MNVDTLIDYAVAAGQVEAGTRADHALHGMSFRLMWKSGARPQRWTEEEHNFLAANLGRLTLEELAVQMGRSRNALKVRFTRFHLPAPSKRIGYLTGNQIAKALGLDVHAVMKLHDRGLMPITNLAGPRHIMQISRIRLYMWAINPENWIYFRVENMVDRHLQRLVEIAQSRWEDEWWSTGQVAAFHGLKGGKANAVETRIMRGKLEGKRWGNWWIKKSVAVSLHFYLGKGGATRRDWSARADAFIVRAHAEGRTDAEMARMMKWSEKTVGYRRRCLESEEK